VFLKKWNFYSYYYFITQTDIHSDIFCISSLRRCDREGIGTKTGVPDGRQGSTEHEEQIWEDNTKKGNEDSRDQDAGEDMDLPSRDH
jgi:hypothetical protein